MTPLVIAHTTDLSGDDDAAFLHACALAAASEARLVTVHGTAVDTSRLPDAAVVSARWGRPIVQERRADECCDDVIDTLVEVLRRVAPELVVTGTHARHGLATVFRGSVGEAIARNVGVPTLVVPNQARGFVDPATGAIDLRRVLVPAGTPDEAIAGIAAARHMLGIAGIRDAAIEVIHATAHGEVFELPELGVTITQLPGTLEHVVLSAAREGKGVGVMIVMVSRGHDGPLDVLRGSHTEHVIRDAGCPVLSVPLA